MNEKQMSWLTSEMERFPDVTFGPVMEFGFNVRGFEQDVMAGTTVSDGTLYINPVHERMLREPDFRLAIRHEIGHLLHYRAVGDERWKALDEEKLSRGDIWHIHRFSPLELRGKMGMVPKEVVAETFAWLTDGANLVARIFDLYERYGGPEWKRYLA